MKKKFFLVIAILCNTIFINAQSENKNIDLTKYVNPFIGTADHGHVFLGASVPFGFVQLGPANLISGDGWDWCSGYNYISNTIVGFTHTHLSGTGIGDLNDILLMPTTGKLFLTEGTNDNLNNGYVSTFSHNNEICKPGYYSVKLDKYNIKAELTATERVGLHRYTFPKDENANVLINLNFGVGWDKTVIAGAKVIDAYTIEGYRNSKGWANDQRIYFTATFSQPILKTSFYEHQQLVSDKNAEGKDVLIVLNFDMKKDKPLQVKVALSPASTANAALNMKTELSGWDFDDMVKQANNKWNKELNKIKIEAGNDVKTTFYTAMFHTLIAPEIYNDVNGDYLGTDKKIYKHAPFTNYTVFSLWDTYRALHPFYTIVEPERINDLVQTMLAIYQQQGRLPVWHLMANETDCMNGNHSISVIVDAYLKGFRNYDVNLAYEAVKNTSMQTRAGMNYVQKLQYIPADSLNETVANALEYAIDDWAVAQFAKALNKTNDYNYFFKRSQLYKKYFDSTTQFMRGRLANGNWTEPFEPLSAQNAKKHDYTEGNAWQYIWLVPQDPYGLIKLMGGEDNFTKKLDSFFALPYKHFEGAPPDVSGLIGQYAQGNEPNHHIAYLYSFVGKPYKTAQIIRSICDTFYTSKTNGLCGNDDVGQMSAWYNFSALGFYPLNPANGVYVLGSPVVSQARITSQKGKIFTISAINNSNKNIYIQKAEWNGKPYTKLFITHKMITGGGELKLYMGNKPSETWGLQKQDRPQ
ncbi:glycosyl hydrolase family 92 [mine drainage metagenome]|uniref:Glycosyl hydrolase family 92 n=1 Tax=mine drainage metagenome TaxID=410659 RepID=A0A1J5TDC1_9ZZZZ